MHQEGVALTKRNDTGPPWSVTDDDRRQRASLVWHPYTICVCGPVINSPRLTNREYIHVIDTLILILFLSPLRHRPPTTPNFSPILLPRKISLREDVTWPATRTHAHHVVRSPRLAPLRTATAGPQACNDKWWNENRGARHCISANICGPCARWYRPELAYRLGAFADLNMTRTS